MRFFTCVCNHKLRFRRSNCGYCFRPTPFWNRWWFLIVVLVAVAAGIYEFAI
jgi:hypothetical protein